MRLFGWLWLGVLGCGDARAPERERQPTPAPRADVRLLVVSALEGQVEGCGCSGATAGGVDRLVSAVAGARAQAQRAGVPSVLVLAGDLLFARPSDALRQQDLWHAQTLAAILGGLRPEVIAPGAFDREHGELLAQLAGGGAPLWLGPRGWQPAAAPLAGRSELLELGGLRLGFVALESESTPVPPLRAASLVLASVRGSEARDAAVRFADVVLQHGSGRPAAPASLAGPATLLLDGGRRADGLLVVDLWLGPPGARGWQLSSGPPAAPATGRVAQARRIPLDASTPADPWARAALDALFQRVNAHNAQHPEPSFPDLDPGPDYVGSDGCAACHTRAYLWWRETRHGRAFQTLVARGRELDRDCICCHTTGFGRAGGASLGSTEHLQGVGCESCHGPGSAHVSNPQAPVDETLQVQVPASACRACHDAEHHPGFSEASARPRLITSAHGRAR